MISSSVIEALKLSIIPGRSSWRISWPSLSEAYPPAETIGLIRSGQYFFQFIKLLELPSENIGIAYEENSCQKITSTSISEIKMIQGEFLSKLWAHHKIKYLELNPDINRSQIIELSLSYGIASKFTSFFCSLHNLEPVNGEMSTLRYKSKVRTKEKAKILSKSRKSLIGCVNLEIKGTSSPLNSRRDRSRNRRSRSRELERIPPIQVSDLYDSIICKFKFEGFWKYEDFEKTFKFMSEINLSLESDDKNDIICTMFIVKYLEKFYKNKQNEWSLILKKAIKWLNAKGFRVENFTEPIEKVLVLMEA